MIIYLSMLETEEERELFSKLYAEERQKLYYIARKYVHNESDAEDAVHNGFRKVMNNFAAYRHQPYENLVKICGAATRHSALDIAREYARRGSFTDKIHFGEDDVEDEGPDVLDSLIREYDKNLIRQAVAELTEDDRELLYLQYGLEIKPKDIGKLLGMSSATVRKKTLRCRNRLAKILEGDEYESLR